jgi:hypothetical protein
MDVVQVATATTNEYVLSEYATLIAMYAAVESMHTHVVAVGVHQHHGVENGKRFYVALYKNMLLLQLRSVVD